MRAEEFDRKFDRGEEVIQELDLSKAKRHNNPCRSSNITQPRVPGLLDGQLGDFFFEPLLEEELQQWE
jgi:hypothetical protein